MDRRQSAVPLVVLGTGVFLAGLELMITAVALPSIVVDLADWTQLRAASWIVNGYLLVSIVAIPLAGRLTDLWGARRLYLAAVALFTIGSALSGRAQGLDELIAGRLVQAAGGGALLPVATAAAAHLYGRHLRSRALGLVGALTFLGMAAGPFAGAAILGALHPADVLAGLGVVGGPLSDAFGAAWRYVFYLNVPIGISMFAVVWAAEGWDTPRRSGRVDLAGAVVFSSAVVAVVGGLTLAGSRGTLLGSLDSGLAGWLLVGLGLVTAMLAIGLGVRRPDPFLDPRLFAIPAFSSAALVSLLTGYGFATAIIGGAVFVDRVLYGGPDTQRLALGTLAGATSLGALLAGLVVRHLGVRAVTLAGLILSAGALVGAAGWTPETRIGEVAGWLTLFGFGFGLTVTPRSMAALEALGRRSFGLASATVTVARMVGMAIGLAVLTAYGSTTIESLSTEVRATPEAYRQYIPEELRERPLRDGLVVQALERWASAEAARVMVGIFVVAAATTAAAALPAIGLGDSTRILTTERHPDGGGSTGGEGTDENGAPDGHQAAAS